MKKFFAVIFALMLLCVSAQAGGPISQKTSLMTASASVAGGSTTVISVAGWSQGTIYGSYTAGAITNFYLTCYGKVSLTDPTDYPIPICDDSTLFPTMDCRPRRFRWQTTAGSVFMFTMPLNFAAIKCTAAGDGAVGETFSAFIRLSNQ